MSELLREEAVLHGSSQAIWAIMRDAAALQRVLPGAEWIKATGPNAFRGVLATRIQFLTVRADVEATLDDEIPDRHVVLTLDGRPRGLAGSFRVVIPFDLAEVPDDPAATSRTTVSYAVDLTVTGRLASFGLPLLRDALRRVIAQLIANVEAELEASAPGGP